MINKVAGLIAGMIIIILFAYVISVFVVHGIERESSVIGTLIGYSPIGIESQMADASGAAHQLYRCIRTVYLYAHCHAGTGLLCHVQHGRKRKCQGYQI